MPPVYRFIEIIVYSLLNFLPFLVLALYPFRHSLRFSRGVTGILIGLLSVIQVLLGAWVSFVPGNHAAIASALSTALYAAFYFLAVKKHFGKTLFTLLMISNLANFAVISAKCIEGLLFPALAMQSYRWSFSMMLFAVEILLSVPIFLYMKSVFTPAETNEQIIRQTVVIAVEISKQCVKLSLAHIFAYDRDMMPHIVFGTAGLGDFFL